MKLPRDLTLNPEATLRIGSFVVDAGRQCLLRPTDGQPMALERSSFDLLLALARQPGEVVGKQALLESVWPGRVVSENSLAQAVRKLRTALGDTDGEAVQLVRGFGYRLALPVAAEPLPAPDPVAAPPPTPTANAAADENVPRARLAPSDPPAHDHHAPQSLARSRAFWAGGLAALFFAGASAAVIAWRDARAGAHHADHRPPRGS